MKTCWLCGRNGVAEPLDRHHIFGGTYRKQSEKYGLEVYWCHRSCHIFGRWAPHQNADVMVRIQWCGQEKAMTGH